MAVFDQRPSVRVIAFDATKVGLLRACRIQTTHSAVTDGAHSLKEYIQVTAAQALANPNQFETVMDGGVTPSTVALPTIVIIGYTAPN